MNVQVTVDGEPLREYEDDAEDADCDSPEVVRWIQSAAGQVFCVQFQHDSSRTLLKLYEIRANVFVDGQYVGGRYLRSRQWQAYGEGVQLLDASDFRKKRFWITRPLIFDNLVMGR